jgi:cytochrome c oxidase cbb3-type subunit 2
MRIGPDLANLGGRKPKPPEADDLYKLLYVGSPTHPSYPFLFERRKVVGQRADTALRLASDSGVGANEQVVPTERAQSLVAYLLTLNTTFDYPEAKPFTPPAEKAEGKAAAAPAKAAPNTEPPPPQKGAEVPGKRPETPVPTAAPDEKKKQEGKK